MEEKYLTTEEVSKIVKMSAGTIRNLVWKNEFKLNVHYVKPTPRKLLFRSSAIKAWLYGKPVPGGGPQIQDNVLSYESDQNHRRI